MALQVRIGEEVDAKGFDSTVRHADHAAARTLALQKQRLQHWTLSPGMGDRSPHFQASRER